MYKNTPVQTLENSFPKVWVALKVKKNYLNQAKRNTSKTDLQDSQT